MTKPSGCPYAERGGDGGSPPQCGPASHFTSRPGRPGRLIPVTGWHEMPFGADQGGTVE